MLMKNAQGITSFGEDANGELYVLDLGGNVSKIVATQSLQMQMMM